MSSPEFSPQQRHSYLTGVVEALEQTAAQIAGSNEFMHQILAMRAETPLSIGGTILGGTPPTLVAGDIDFHNELGLIAQDTIKTAATVMDRVGGMPLIYEDDVTQQQVRKTAFGLYTYSSATDTWTLITAQDPPKPEPFRAPPLINRTTAQLRAAFEQAWDLTGSASSTVSG